MSETTDIEDVRFCKGCDAWRDFGGRRRHATYHSDDCRFAYHHKKDKDWIRLKEEQDATLAEASRVTGLTRSQILYRAGRDRFSIQRVDGRIYVSRASLSTYLGGAVIPKAEARVVAEASAGVSSSAFPSFITVSEKIN